jgi:putative lipase involved disintegration of autophagic bodies
MPLSEVFWVAFITTMTGFVLKLVSMAYKSKCKTCKVCCIEVVRDTEAEAEIDELRITTLPPPPPNSPTNRTESFNQL